MDLCYSCHAAAKALYPQAKHDRPVQTVLEQHVPKLDHDSYNNCWICYRLVKWLEVHDRTNLKSWLQAPLPVTYNYLGPMTAQFPFGFKQVLSYMIMIIPGHSVPEKSDIGECIELACVDQNVYNIMLQTCQPSQLTQIDFALIERWISQCRSHEHCDTSDSFLPMRLIQIGSNGRTAKLIHTEAEFGSPDTVLYRGQRYVTVSHRWSTMQYKKLFADTLHDLQQGIEVSTLPQVFQDAFVIAARVDISLVWIDSLCIMQDNGSDDLNTQCRLMHKIYASGFLNISATGCENNQGSLLNRRIARTNPRPQTFRASYGFFPWRRYIVEGHVWIDEIANAPLSHRGWVFQERHLSRRILHLGSNLMAWECRGLDALEVCPDGLPDRIILNSLAKRDLFRQLEEARTGSSDGLTRLYAIWTEMVEEYSRCELSKSSDKLIALEGLAAYFDDKIASDRAPSWSWASVEGGISFPQDLQSPATRPYVFDIEYVRDPTDATTTDHSPEHKTAIALEGYLYDFKCLWRDAEISSFVIGKDIVFPVFKGTPCNAVHIDGPVSEFKGYKNLLFLVLVITNVSIHGLILSPLEGQSWTYERVGSVEIAVIFPYTEINGKKVIDDLPGVWIENYVPGSWFPYKASVGPFLYSQEGNCVRSAILESRPKTKVLIK